ncbi:MAG: hypothetical protein RBT75_21630 [Anaerolineae bacterium]|jgi:hypothetical protein|nr:hypothetical protein [Anaerolineae bacterium]
MVKKRQRLDTEVKLPAELEENADFDSLPVIDIANDENDDWIKKANPQAAREEIEIHERLEAQYRAEAEARAKAEKQR